MAIYSPCELIACVSDTGEFKEDFMGSDSSKTPMPTQQWRAKLQGETIGPLSELEVRELLAAEDADGDLMLQQGESPFYAAEEVRSLFQRIDEQGYYVQTTKRVEGPFLEPRLIVLLEQGLLDSPGLMIRKGKGGAWQTADAFKQQILGQQQSGMDPGSKSPLIEMESDQDSSPVGERNSVSLHQSSLEAMEFESGPAESKSGSVASNVDAIQQALILGSADFLSSASPDSSSSGSVHSSIPVVKSSLKSPVEKIGRNQQSQVEANPSDLQDTLSSVRTKRVRTGGKRGLLCLDCGRQINVKTGRCEYCLEEEKKERLEALAQPELDSRGGGVPVQASVPSDGINLTHLKKIIAIIFAFATSGVFSANGLVRSVIWRPMHSAQQQLWGWFALLVGVILAGAAVAVIRYEFERRQFSRLERIGIMSFTLASVIAYFVVTDPLRSIDAEIRDQRLMWSEAVEQGAYEAFMDRTDRSQSRRENGMGESIRFEGESSLPDRYQPDGRSGGVRE